MSYPYPTTIFHGLANLRPRLGEQCGYLSSTIIGISETVLLSIAATLVQHTAAATHRYLTAIMYLVRPTKRNSIVIW
ncbi:hypothetical protein I7I48_05407 [Histoplasma ohiense]|nr:hypothetical protein I7I48_05407 [Histoplasma ohiense (nom. inval.)]